MHFQFSEDTQQMQRTLRRFMDSEVLPYNDEYERIAASGTYPTEVVEPLKRKARDAGLWNLFLPALREDEPGTRLTNLQYAPLAEHGPLAVGFGGIQLQCAGHRQHGAAAPVRHTGAARAVAQPPAGRAHPFLLLHDGAGRRLVRRDQHPDEDAARRR